MIDWKTLAIVSLLGALGAGTHYLSSVPTPVAAAAVAVLIGITGALQSYLLPKLASAQVKP